MYISIYIHKCILDQSAPEGYIRIIFDVTLLYLSITKHSYTPMCMYVYTEIHVYIFVYVYPDNSS
jgi:uncharacterized membrane protein affecting hemolysin expression